MQIESGVVVTLLSDDELIARLRGWVAYERKVSARLLEHLGEAEARGLYRDQGFGSMFEYAVHGLHMSESEAGLRLYVARQCREFPEALEMLARGELHLTALRLLAPKLTRDTIGLLEEARFKTKQQVLELLAKHYPQANVSSSIRRLSHPRAEPGQHVPSILATADEPGQSSEPGVADRVGTESPRVAHAAASFCLQPPAAVVPLSETHHVVRFTATNELKDKIKQAQDLLRHQCPSGDLAVVFERALDLLIAERRKAHFGEARKPPAARPAPFPRKTNTRYIPRAVRREVVERDAEQCTFVSPDGRRCAAHGFLEFDHITPFARGGRATADNLRLRCRSHNALLAERLFGRDFMLRAAGAEQQELDRQRVTSPSVRSVTYEHVPDVKEDLTSWLAG